LIAVALSTACGGVGIAAGNASLPALSKQPAPVQPKPSSITPVPWTPLMLRTSITPQPFRGSDGQSHIIYDLIFNNFSDKPVSLTKLELLDTDGRVIKTFDEHELEHSMLGLQHGSAPQQFVSGGTAVLFVNLDFAKDSDAPDLLRHRITIAHQMFGAPGIKTYEAAPTPVDKRPPIVIGPPLAGGNWLAAGGYAGAVGHRKALFCVNNKLASSQCYAIDWIRIDPTDRRSVHGDTSKNESDLAYGQSVLAVADGTISGVIDRFPDQRPNAPEGNDRFDYPEGNVIVEDIGSDLFVMYAHLKPGSVKVKEGQRVKRGAVMALVGNSGNSTSTHLHMHVMDGAHPIASNGVPYLFDSFSLVGEIKDINRCFENVASGRPQPVDAAAVAGEHKNELPREGAVVVFPEIPAPPSKPAAAPANMKPAKAPGK
jgi:Peptidase family M23